MLALIGHWESSRVRQRCEMSLAFRVLAVVWAPMLAGAFTVSMPKRRPAGRLHPGWRRATSPADTAAVRLFTAVARQNLVLPLSPASLELGFSLARLHFTVHRDDRVRLFQGCQHEAHVDTDRRQLASSTLAGDDSTALSIHRPFVRGSPAGSAARLAVALRSGLRLARPELEDFFGNLAPSSGRWH